MRFGKPSVAALACLVVVGTTPLSSAQVAAPNSHVYGGSLAQWFESYVRWNYTGGGADVYRPGPAPVVFMPMPPATWDIVGDKWISTGTKEVTLKPGTAFVLPIFIWTQFTYTDYPTDPIYSLDELKTNVTGPEGTGLPSIVLDGKPILKNFWAYYSGAIPLDPVIDMPQPDPYTALQLLAIQGVAMVVNPLAPGTHTLTLDEEAVLGGYDVVYHNTWTITVVPTKQK